MSQITAGRQESNPNGYLSLSNQREGKQQWSSQE